MHAKSTMNDMNRKARIYQKLMSKHRAYGHPSNKTMTDLINSTDDHGLTNDEIQMIPSMPRCHECDQAQMPSHKGAKLLQHKRMHIPNRLVMHSDLSGKKSTSVRGYKHFALYVIYKHDGKNMRTRCLMCDLLKCKSDLATALEKRLKLIKNMNKYSAAVTYLF